MKMSRPWNVAETGCDHRSPLVSWTARLAPPSAETAQDSSPLSGPTRMECPACDRDRPPGRADAGVDHPHVHRGRQVADGLGQHGRAAPDVARLHQVGDVDELNRRGDAERDALARGDKPVVKPVVGQESQVAKASHEW